MRCARVSTLVVGLLLASAGPAPAQHAESDESDQRHRSQGRMERQARMGQSAMRHEDAPVEKAVRDVVSAFWEAMRAGDGAAVLALLHPAVRIYEGGHAETREEYQQGHLEADVAFRQAVARETIRDTVVDGHRMALYLSEYRVTGSFRGREIDGRGVETIALVPTEEGWRIRHIHWSSR